MIRIEITISSRKKSPFTKEEYDAYVAKLSHVQRDNGEPDEPVLEDCPTGACPVRERSPITTGASSSDQSYSLTNLDFTLRVGHTAGHPQRYCLARPFSQLVERAATIKGSLGELTMEDDIDREQGKHRKCPPSIFVPGE